MRRLTLLALVAAAACKSSAPYTIPSAVINSAVAVGASAERRAGGDCFTPCTHGTVCNPRSGYCEPAPCGGKCQAWEVCVESAGVARCAGTAAPALSVQQPGPSGEPGGFTPSIGVSPATGTVPTLPPEKASPEKP